MTPSDALITYYNRYDEASRLSGPWGQIEFTRTQEIITRYLPPQPACILDVGGASGRYACWLAGLGHQVHLVDPVPRHVRQAQAASAAQPDSPLTSCSLGDARRLAFGERCADVILLLGPLYHLTNSKDRHMALTEASRILKPGGVLFAAAISRFASTLDGLDSGYFQDPAFQTIMRQDLATGQHRNPTGNPAYFMDTFFHHPNELHAEVAATSLHVEALLAVEGICYLIQDLSTHWNNPEYRRFILEILSTTESEPTLLGASPHLLCVAQKPL
jgi:ubiquinone/menaquinone biosynthesis C-methylase UbiE